MRAALPISVQLTVAAGSWGGEEHLSALARQIFALPELSTIVQLPMDAEVSLLFTDDDQMRGLNGQWRDQDKPTNVLSFAANEGLALENWFPMLGDIALAYETIACEAVAQGKEFHDHLTHLIIHGYLHLIGYDHETEHEAQAMEALEIKLLSQLGIADPYLDA